MVVSKNTHLHAVATLVIVSLGFGISAVEAQQSDNKAEILGKVSDGTPPPPSPPREIPRLAVIDSTVHQLEDRAVTMKRVVDPGFPDPIPPSTNKVKDESSVDLVISPELAKEIEAWEKIHVLSLSSTVIDHRVTFLRWRYEDDYYEGWSNIDFNHLSGFGYFRIGEQYYSPWLGIGNLNYTAEEIEGWLGKPVKFETQQPDFVVTKGDVGNLEALEGVEALHELYRQNKKELQEAYEGRERAKKAREAYLREHPPQPEDVEIQFWRRKDRAVERHNAKQMEAGQ